MKATETTDVLVVGAGPVGMFTALCLADRGLRVAIVDQYNRTALHSYALALHAQALGLLDEHSLASELVDRGQVLRRIALHHADGEAEIDLGGLGGPYPHVLVVPQMVLEAALERRLAEHGVFIRWNHQALTFDVDSRGAVTLLAQISDDGEPEPELETTRMRSTFLIGADGYESFTRRLLEFDQTVVGDPIALGLMEFEASIASPDLMQIVIGPDTTDVLWPLGSGRARWSVQLPGPVHEVDAPGLKATVRSRAQWFGDEFGTIDWMTSVCFERRLARRFGRGPVWLVGDAARFTTPVGVQSMNVGFREGHDLARRIADILLEDRSPRLLDYYNEERMREWKMLLGLKDRVETHPETPGWARDLAPQLVGVLPATGHDLNVMLEQIGLRLYWLRRRDHA